MTVKEKEPTLLERLPLGGDQLGPMLEKRGRLVLVPGVCPFWQGRQ